MANVKGSCSPSYSFTQTGLLGTNANGSVPEANTWNLDLSNGTLLNQCDLIHAKTYTLAASTPQTIDLYGGSLLDLYGAACLFRRIVLLAYRVQSTNDAHEVLIGGAAATEWLGWIRTAGGKVAAAPSAAGSAGNNGFTLVAAPNTTGFAVTSSSKSLKFDPGSNAVGAFDFIAIGRSS